jgi:ribosomal protein S26
MQDEALIPQINAMMNSVPCAQCGKRVPKFAILHVPQMRQLPDGAFVRDTLPFHAWCYVRTQI